MISIYVLRSIFSAVNSLHAATVLTYNLLCMGAATIAIGMGSKGQGVRLSVYPILLFI